MRNIGQLTTVRNGLLAVAAGILLSLAPRADAADPDPIVLRSRVFDIPFHIDGSSAARAVKLYVSTDRGQSWRVADEQTLPVTGFHIEATEDGEHWFAHATDLDDITDPAGQLTAERKILIDSLGPAIKLGGEADLGGTFAGRVTLSDRHGTASLRILYATDVDRQWISVANESVDGEGRFQIRPDSDWRQMSVHVTATDSIGNVSVEARTFRRPRIAGKENRLRIRPAAGPSDPPSFMLGPKPFADRSPETTDTPAPAGPALTAPYAESRSSSETSPPAGANAFRGLGTFGSAFGPSADNRPQRRTPRPSPISTGSPSAGGMPPAATENSPADAAADAATPEAATTGLATLPAAGLAAKVTPKGVEVLETPPPDPAEPAAASEASPPAQSAPSSGTGGVPLNAPTLSSPSAGEPITKSTLPPGTDSERVNRSMPNRDDSNSPARPRTLSEAMGPLMPEAKTPTPAKPEEIPTPSPSSTPEDRRRQRVERATTLGREQQERYDRAQLARSVPFRFSDSNRFSLEYELEAVAASGVESVELYGSTDAGRTWKRWGADPDRTSPFDIETRGEGVFGFQIVVIGNNGLASPRPLAGDNPDIAVIVDQTLPEIKITSAQYGEGNRTGSLVIRYECSDENLMTRPVSISFSESLEGPWTTIAAGLRNDGLYVWPADPKLPPQIYLRIDATDQAGNTGTFLLDQPIATSGLAPRARILGFRSR